MTDQVPEIGFSGTRNQLKNGLKASWTTFFFNNCQIFDIFEDFSKFTLKKHQIWQILEKSLFQLALNQNLFIHALPKPWFWIPRFRVPEFWLTGIRVPGFRVPDLSLKISTKSCVWLMLSLFSKEKYIT